MNQKLLVLIVEDSETMAEILKYHLTQDGNIVTEWVESLAEAIHRISRDGISVVVLDLHLPDAKELEALEAIMEEHDHIPVVVVTGNGTPEIEERAMAMRAQDFLHKGDFSGKDLIRAVRHAACRHDARKAVDERFAPVRQSFQETTSAIMLAEKNKP